MAHRILDGGRFITAVHHAIGALLIVAGPVGVPIGFFHQRAKTLRVAFAQQVARTLPAEDVSCWIAPWRAAIVAIPGEEIEEQTGLTERPRARAAASAEDVAEQLLGACA